MTRTPPKLVCGPIVRSTGMAWSSIWVELDGAAAIMARAHQHHPAPKRGARRTSVDSDLARTVAVQGRHYALMWLDDLEPGTLYTYELRVVAIADPKKAPRDAKQFRAQKPARLDLEKYRYGLGPTLRTFPKVHAEEVRIAFGSCRCFEGGYHGVFGEDVFEAFATHLGTIAADRVTKWPTMLLLLGDQIYGDDVARSVVAKLDAKGHRRVKLDTLRGTYEHLQEAKEYARAHGIEFNTVAGTGQFHLAQYDDYATLYQAAWSAGDVPKLLANIPAFMLCDDHEVTDKWNITGGWVVDADNHPEWHSVVIHGMMAYWLYQGWGNHRWPDDDPRIHAIAEARATGEDAYQRMYYAFERWLDGDRLVNYFRIASTPPVLALDTRSDRKHVAPVTEAGVTRWADAQDRIISDAQLAWLKDELRGSEPIVIASSVPLVQTAGIDAAQFVAVRGITDLGRRFEMLTQGNANLFEFYRRDFDLETISAFPMSWLELLVAITKVERVVWIAGDIHFSAIHHGEVRSTDGTCRLTHVVSSGFRHLMAAADFEFVETTADPVGKVKAIDVGALEGATLQASLALGGDIGAMVSLAQSIGQLVPERDETS